MRELTDPENLIWKHKSVKRVQKPNGVITWSKSQTDDRVT